jgi:oxygen-dependent protoporphyrinogen oxidase
VHRAVVVGGGVAGLVAARELRAAGRDVVLIERASHPGGAVRSAAIADVAVDVGAEAFALTRPETRDLVHALGLDDAVTAPRRSDARLVLADAVVALPPSLLGVPTDLASPQLLAAVGGDAIRLAQRLDSRPPRPTEAAVTLGALVRERFGEVVLARVVAPVVAGVHACHPDTVQADAVVPGLRAAYLREGSLAGGAASLRRASGVPGAAVAGLVGGMTTLVTALVDDLERSGVRVRTSTEARAAQPHDRGWRVQTADEDLIAGELVVAVDALEAARVLAALPTVAAPLATIAPGDVAVVAVLVDDPRLDDDPLGSGALVAQPHPLLRLKALTHATAKWDWLRRRLGPGRHVLRLSYGLDGSLGVTPQGLADAALADLAGLLDVPSGAVRRRQVTHWPRSLVRPTPAHSEAVQTIDAAVAPLPGLAVVGAGIGGNGLAATIARSLTDVGRLTLCSQAAAPQAGARMDE